MAYNTRNPAVKRLMKEAQELNEPTEMYHARPLEDNLFEWHFTIRGPADTDFEGGIYHGRILLPPDYPMKPPNILLLTPNGRFELNRKICLSISGYHPETWRPSWSIRTALLAIIGFMPTHGFGAIGALDYPPDQRKKLAKESVCFNCPECGCVGEILKPLTDESQKIAEEAQSLASQISFNVLTKSEDGNSSTENKETTPLVSVEESSSTTTTTESLSTNQQATASISSPPVASWCNFVSPSLWADAQSSSLTQLTATAPPSPLSFIEWLDKVKNIKVNENDNAETLNGESFNNIVTHRNIGGSSSSTASNNTTETPVGESSSPTSEPPTARATSSSTTASVIVAPVRVVSPLTFSDKCLLSIAMLLGGLVLFILIRNILFV